MLARAPGSPREGLALQTSSICLSPRTCWAVTCPWPQSAGPSHPIQQRRSAPCRLGSGAAPRLTMVQQSSPTLHHALSPETWPLPTALWSLYPPTPRPERWPGFVLHSATEPPAQHHHGPKPKAEALPECPLHGCRSSSASFRDLCSQCRLFCGFSHPSGPVPYHLHLYLFNSPDLRNKTSVPPSSPPSYYLSFLFSAKFSGKGPPPMPSLLPCLLDLSSGQAGSPSWCPPPFCSSPVIWAFSPALKL